MEVTDIVVGASPTARDRVRLSATVSYELDARREEYWFEVDSQFEPFLSTSGNPWLVCLAPLAATVGEPLRVHAPVDPVLLDNVRGLAEIWRSWYRNLTPVAVEAEVVAPLVRDQSRAATAAFFSGGIDSQFTILRHLELAPTIDDLLYVSGFYIYVREDGGRARIRRLLERRAVAAGRGFVEMSTNLRQTGWSRARWAPLAFGCGLVAAGLCLERRYSSLLLGSTNDYARLQPWGSHPLTDPLLSTETTTVIHDGAADNRVEKIRLVAGSADALRSILICSRLQSDRNCGECSKCLPTMAALDLFGALGDCETFPQRTFDPRSLGRVFAYSRAERLFLADVLETARYLGRRDIVRAIERSLRHSRRLRPAVRVSRSIQHRSLLERLGGKLEHVLLLASIT